MLVEVDERLLRQLELRNGLQDDVPVPAENVVHERLGALHDVQADAGLVLVPCVCACKEGEDVCAARVRQNKAPAADLQRRERVLQPVLLHELLHQPNDAKRAVRDHGRSSTPR